MPVKVVYSVYRIASHRIASLPRTLHSCQNQTLSPPIPPCLVGSEQTLARKLNLPRRLARPEPALGDARPLALCELKLVVVCVPRAGAVVREVDAGEGVGAEVPVAGGCYCCC